MVVPAVIGAAGAIGAGVAGFAGSGAQNRANQRMAREQMEFQRRSMGEQMGFQERMSNTAYQRAVQDMTKAGLNPMLAYMQGGSSTPSGSALGGSTAEMQNRLGAGISSALQARNIEAQVANVKAMTEILKAELPEKKASAVIFGSKLGPMVKGLQLVSGMVNSAKALGQLVKPHMNLP